MSTEVEQTEEWIEVKWYDIPYPVSAYTFPQEALIHQVRLMMYIFISN